MKAARLAFVEAAVTSSTDECILWPFGKRGRYGRVYVNGKTVSVHRYVCERTYGPCPPDKQHAAHRCGVHLCINPRHVRWATCAENEADKFIHRMAA